MLTTDTHFNHTKIKEYCNRPDNYEELIINGWKSLCPDKHILIHLGDVCIGRETEAHEKYIIPIKCKKILIKGNHDTKSNSWYMEHGWDWACENMTIGRGGKRILLSHMPMVWDGYYDVNFHGHFHNSNHRRWEAELKGDLLKGQRLLALEYNDYKLWDLDKELERLTHIV
jgi:calcineurin-like phosphoesterase family protein